MNRKGQEEITGFVAIIVIVSIVGIILLGFIIKNQSSASEKDNRDLLRFLESALIYTSNCTLDYGYSYKSIKELTKICHQKPDSVCLNGKNVCGVLNQTLQDLLEAGWGKVDNSTFVTGYSYTATFSKNLSTGYESEEFVSIVEGTCIGSDFRSYTLPLSNNPNIDGRVKVCFKG